MAKKKELEQQIIELEKEIKNKSVLREKENCSIKGSSFFDKFSIAGYDI